MADKIWEERRIGINVYFESGNPLHAFGDVRSEQPDYEKPVLYRGLVYTPVPYGTQLGTFSNLSDAMAAVEAECIRQSL